MQPVFNEFNDEDLMMAVLACIISINNVYYLIEFFLELSERHLEILA